MEAKPPEPIAEEMLDKVIDVVEGPLNKVGEKVLSSTIVLAPISLAMNLGLRLMARVTGRSAS